MRDLHRPEVAAHGAAGLAALAVALTGAARLARADHEGAMGGDHHGAGPGVSVGLSVEAAEFDTTSYVGSYQGVTPSLGWASGRFGATAAISVYHLTKNGLSVYGPGDAMFGGHATVIQREALHAGVALHMHAPTGSELDGLGMGHVHVTPSVWASWHLRRLTLNASGGYSRAIFGGAHHDHDGGPLVAPMNLQELSWNAGADVALGAGVQVGGRALGGVPIGDGVTRVITGGHLVWGSDRISTGIEAQVGLAGDPFTIRGVAETTLRF
ncbi:MAG TPA: hypothetical protein VFT22_27130 [Kofleriaceae bacterium]|nr:hypothetical protein [Kofleriaceae bacterium]